MLSMRKQGMMEAGDERVLGSGDFVSSLLEQAEEGLKKQLAGGERQVQVKQDIEETCQDAGISVAYFRSGSRSGVLPEMRKKLAVKFVSEYGLSLAETARRLGVTTNAIAYIMKRNR